MANRFSRGPIAADVQSEFIPLPIDLIDRQLDRRQNYFDVAKASIRTSQDAWHGVQGHSADTETLRGITAAYDQKILDQLNAAGGDYSQLTSFADELGMELSKDLKSGHLAGISRNFALAQTEMEELKKRRDNNKISEASYNRRLHEIANFKGTHARPDGGYSTLSVSRAPESMDLAVYSDNLAEAIADQYRRTGARYIDATTAREHVRNDLIRNEQVVQIARDEVWARFGDLPPDKEAEAVMAYIDQFAKKAGHKIAFEQHLVPKEGTGTEKIPLQDKTITFNMAAARTGDTRYNTVMEEFYKSFESTDKRRRRSERNQAGLELLGKATKVAIIDGLVNNDLGVYNEIGEMLGIPNIFNTDASLLEHFDNMAQSQQVKVREKAALALRDFSKNDIAVAIAANLGIDLKQYDTEVINTKEAFENMAKLIERMDLMDKHAANVQMTTTLSREVNEDFQLMVKQGTLNTYVVTDLITGEVLTHKEKDDIVIRERQEGNVIMLSGMVEAEGQSIPRGSVMGSFIDGNTIRHISWLPQDKSRSQEFQRDRALAAFNLGIVNYSDGERNITLIPLPDGSGVQRFINGKKKDIITLTVPSNVR